MLGPLARISNQLGRNVMLKSVRNGSHGGVPGEAVNDEGKSVNAAAKEFGIKRMTLTRFMTRFLIAQFAPYPCSIYLTYGNLPFSIHSKAWLTWNFIWFFGSGFGAPFLIMLHQLRKK